MSRLQEIEKALISINDVVFQELCDSFLKVTNKNYAAFSRSGTQAGKQKSKVGTPDSFFLLPSGKYIFVEHSTNISEGVQKLIDDINKCLDTAKTNIGIDEIAEIILCLNFKLKPVQIKNIHALIDEYNIGLTIYTLDDLAIELHLQHRDLAHIYLGLHLDTGQIVSMNQFISEYDNRSRGISTRLDNVFIHRERELLELQSIIGENDFLIVTGAAGVGKTKLCLEAIYKFIANNPSFRAYCISYKHTTLIDDLFQNLDGDHDNILFVDDANRIDALNQIIQFYSTIRATKLKVIVTVRDYAFSHVNLLSSENRPFRYTVGKMTDEHLVDILTSDSFRISNTRFHTEILRIADGNPRLAVMTALLAIAKQDIEALQDVSDLFEVYFSTFIMDNDRFSQEISLKVLGLISFFFAVPYKEKNTIEPMLNDFGVTYANFVDTIDSLEKLEIVDIQFDNVKISEQNLASYFFYKCFIKDKLLSFSTLLRLHFKSNERRFTDCVISCNNSFGPARVMEALTPDIKSYFKDMNEDLDSLYKIIQSFWFYLQTETLEYYYFLIESFPATIPSYDLESIGKINFRPDKHIDILSNYFALYESNLVDAIELSLEYVRKNNHALSDLIKAISNSFQIDQDDVLLNYFRQRKLLEVLYKGIAVGDNLSEIVYFHLISSFLTFSVEHTKGGRNHTYAIYRYPIEANEWSKTFRSEVWQVLIHQHLKYPEKVLQIFSKYTVNYQDVDFELVAIDYPFIIKYIKQYLDLTNFMNCIYVDKQIIWFQRVGFLGTEHENMRSNLKSPLYDRYVKLDWHHYNGKEIHDYDNPEEYKTVKEAELRSSFLFRNIDDIEEFYHTYCVLRDYAKNPYGYINVLNCIIDANYENNPNIAFALIEVILKTNNSTSYTPDFTLVKKINDSGNVAAYHQLLKKYDYNAKFFWLLSFYSSLSKEYAVHITGKDILEAYQMIDTPTVVNIVWLECYFEEYPTLLTDILNVIFNNNQIKAQITVPDTILSSLIIDRDCDINMIMKTYVQQSKINPQYDRSGKVLKSIVSHNKDFLQQIIIDRYKVSNDKLQADHSNFGCLWEIDGIEETISNILDLTINKDFNTGTSFVFGNCFFRQVDLSYQLKSDQFLIKYLERNVADLKKVNAVVDITRRSRRNLFPEILLKYISLVQDVKAFKKIWWRGNATGVSGKQIFGDVEAADWRKILEVVKKSPVGYKLLPIKKYLSDKIDDALMDADFDRKKQFISDRY